MWKSGQRTFSRIESGTRQVSGWFILVDVISTEQGSDLFQKFRLSKWLSDKVIGANLESLFPILPECAGGNSNDFYCMVADTIADIADHFIAIHEGHNNVHLLDRPCIRPTLTATLPLEGRRRCGPGGSAALLFTFRVFLTQFHRQRRNSGNITQLHRIEG
jgi:hypothetical protein